jgi:hypothetical protein
LKYLDLTRRKDLENFEYYTTRNFEVCLMLPWTMKLEWERPYPENGGNTFFRNFITYQSTRRHNPEDSIII